MVMNKTKLVLMLPLAIILILLPILASCGEPEPAAEKILKVGSIFPTSGFGAAFGIPNDRGTHLMAEQINAAGGFTVAGETYKLEIISVDTKLTPEGSAAAIHKLAYDDKVKFSIGPMVGFECSAIQPTSEKEKILLLCAGFPKEVIGPEKPSHEIIPINFSWIKETYPDVKRVFVYDENTESGPPTVEFAQSFCQFIGGLEVVGFDYFEPGQKDFYAGLGKVLAAEPDLISVMSAPPDFCLVVKQARELGYTGLFDFDVPFPEAELLAITGAEAAEGCVGSGRITKGDYAREEAKEFRRIYMEKYGVWDDAGIDVGLGVPILVQAIESANSLDVDKVRAVLDSDRSYDTPIGSLKFWGESFYGVAHQLIQPMCVLEMRSGEAVQKKVVEAAQQIALLEEWAQWEKQ
jgi:branched-chain amino acid transport system substrate-binding protein